MNYNKQTLYFYFYNGLHLCCLLAYFILNQYFGLSMLKTDHQTENTMCDSRRPVILLVSFESLALCIQCYVVVVVAGGGCGGVCVCFYSCVQLESNPVLAEAFRCTQSAQCDFQLCSLTQSNNIKAGFSINIQCITTTFLAEIQPHSSVLILILDFMNNLAGQKLI